MHLTLSGCHITCISLLRDHLRPFKGFKTFALHCGEFMQFVLCCILHILANVADHLHTEKLHIVHSMHTL